MNEHGTEYFSPKTDRMISSGRRLHDQSYFHSYPLKYVSVHRGSPIRFSGSRMWLISRPGFGILKERGDEIRDCSYDRDTGFGDFNQAGIGICRFKETEIPKFQRLKYAKKMKLILLRSEIAEQWLNRHPRFPRPYHTALWPLWWSVTLAVMRIQFYHVFVTFVISWPWYS